ncbi:MAG: hypothetical protein ABJB74_04425, partial [Gemmatimonas sp.]
VTEYAGQNVIVESFKNAWRIFVSFVAGLISSLGWIVPLGAIGALLFVLSKRWTKYYDKVNANKTTIKKPDVRNPNDPM